MDKYLVIYRDRHYKDNYGHGNIFMDKYESYGVRTVPLESLIKSLSEDSDKEINKDNWRSVLENNGEMLIAVIPSWLPDDFEHEDTEEENVIDPLPVIEGVVLQDPVSVIKISDGTVVDNVYRSDLPCWEKQGYEIYLPSLND
jgi:hypothetical protein